MEAAGQLDDPKYQTPEGKAQLLHQLRVGTHNDLFVSTLFGFFAPAAPSYDTQVDAVDGFQGSEPDWSAHLTGLGSLKDEARKLFSALPYEDAKAWWQAVHPGELVYAPTGVGSRSTVGAEDASAPATVAAASYIEDNRPFFDKYGGKGGLAAYLIPQGKPGTVNGSYSDVAYRAQLELGVREYKSLEDYFDTLVLSNGLSAYFAEKDKYDAAKAQTTSPAAKAQLDAQWADTKDRLQQANPLLSAKLASYAVNNAVGNANVARLFEMVQDTDPATVKALGVNKPGIEAMLVAQAQYKDATDALGSRRGNVANRKRTEARTAYDATIAQIADHYPGLADLARGVFRLPD